MRFEVPNEDNEFITGPDKNGNILIVDGKYKQHDFRKINDEVT